MPDTDKTFIEGSRRLLWFRVQHVSDGTIVVKSYHPRPSEVGEWLAPKTELSPQEILDKFEAVRKREGEKDKYWKSHVTSTERIIAQIAEGRNQSFVIRYYSIGFVKVGKRLDETRLASYFIFDAEGRQPELAAFFDFQYPVPAKSIAEFFRLKDSAHRKDWIDSKGSFETIQKLDILLRRSLCDGTEYIGLDVRSELHDYPRGRLIGGLPFGKEDKFLALCKIGKGGRDSWTSALKHHKELFGAWNVICRKRSTLKRIFIEGEPGSGKELWADAIKNGSRPHRSGDWKTLSATLPTDEMKKILYGEQEGALERQGFLASCADGGVFIDEIGKSYAEFRRDLLRVLEARQYVPVGGRPTDIRNVLFVFASTEKDRTYAYDPPDFWTRMDASLVLPKPVMLRPRTKQRSRVSPFSKYDEARFHALLGTFWLDALLDALKEQRGGPSPDPVALLADFSDKVFKPIVRFLAKKPLKKRIPVSPRRVNSLAATLASEYQWLGKPPEDLPEARRRKVEKAFNDHREQFVTEFLKHLVQDEKNNDELRKMAELRRAAARRAASP